MGWEPPQPIRPKPKKLILPFGDLKKVVRRRSHYLSPFVSQIQEQETQRKAYSEWREEQFARAVAKQSMQLTAWEALHHQVR